MVKYYIVKTVTPEGKFFTETVQAEDKASLEQNFVKKNRFILAVTEKNSLFEFLKNLNIFKKSVKPDDLVLFSKELAILIKGGLPLVNCLSILSVHTSNLKLQETIKFIKNDVEGGAALSESMAKCPEAFSVFYTATIKSGENTDNLTEVLNKLAEYLGIISTLRKKVISALVYPLFLVTLAFFATAYLIIFVVPVFAKLYSDLGRNLPALTNSIISLSNFLRGYYFLILVLFLGLYAISMAIKPRIKVLKDSLQLKLPVIKDISIKYMLATTTRTISMLLKSGVPLTKAIEISSELTDNDIAAEKLSEAARGITAGETFADSLKNTGLFPALTIEMVHTGEQTGALDEMLDNASNIYQEEVNSSISTLLVIIEPVMMLILGLFIAIVLLSMYLPIFELSASF